MKKYINKNIILRELEEVNLDEPSFLRQSKPRGSSNSRNYKVSDKIVNYRKEALSDNYSKNPKIIKSSDIRITAGPSIGSSETSFKRRAKKHISAFTRKISK